MIELIGLPTDINSSFERGAALGSAAIRAALLSDRGNMACEDGRELGTDIPFSDCGDLPLAGDNAHDDALIANAIAETLDRGAIPLSLGGDHSVPVPILAAIHARHGPVSILQLDAHPDLYDDFGGNPRSHASPFARIMEAGHAARLVQFGIRTMSRHCREQAAHFGVEVIDMRNFIHDKVPILDGPTYITLDLDGFDPAFSPGVSHPEPGGLSPRDVLAVLDRVTGPIVGADICELNPRFDVNGITAILAAKLVREVAARMVPPKGGAA